MDREFTEKDVSSQETDDRLGIQSVEVAAQILSAFVAGGGYLQLKEISALTGMHRGKVHRYLTSLTRSGLLSQDERGTYAIGTLALSLGLTALRRLDPVRIAYQELPKLSQELKESAILAVWGEWGATVVALQESPWPVTLNIRAGSILPLRTSATAQAFEAYLPQSSFEPVLRRYIKDTDTDVPQSFDTLEAIREYGIARADETVLSGIRAMAAPVFDHTERICLVVGIVGRKETLNIGWDSYAADHLRNFAKSISEKLGQKA